jgi:flagellar biosynthetic protein FliR
MVTFTSGQLNALLAAYLWPFFRILALLSTGPLFSQSTVPVTAKIGLAGLLTIIVAPTLGAMPDVGVSSPAGLMIAANQLLIGVSIGLTMQVVFAAVEGAGEFVGLQMGLSFAQLITPTAQGGATQVMANLLNVIAVLVFLSVDGHLHMLTALMETFTTLPISLQPLRARGMESVAAWGAAVFSGGLMLALPLIATLLIASLALGILNRAAPQVGVYQVGFAISLLVGMLMLDWTLPAMAPFVVQLLERGFDTVTGVIE